jgi:hypothetical protein
MTDCAIEGDMICYNNLKALGGGESGMRYVDLNREARRTLSAGQKATNSTTPSWSDWDAENWGFTCEAGVGLTVLDNMKGLTNDSRWLCWNEVVAFHGWLGEKINEFQNADHPPPAPVS